MDELTALVDGANKDRDLVDKLLSLLDRQTDHKLSPNLLLGFLGLFNVLSIVSIVHGGEIKEIGSVSENPGLSTRSAVDNIVSMLKPQGNGQPDLMGLLNGIAAKKKINPNLLLSLLSMLNNQVGQSASPQAGQSPEEAVENRAAVSEEKQENKTEKKTPDDKQEAELRYDRKREGFRRT